MDEVRPEQYVMFGVGVDGNMVMDFPDDEMTGRALAAWLQAELDRHYVNRRMQAMLEQAKDRRIHTPRNGRVN